MAYKTIEFRSDERGVAWLTLNRPEMKNAMNGDMYDEARAVVAQVDADPNVRVLVLTGAGDAFCSGGDFKYQQSQAQRKAHERLTEASKLALWLGELDTLSKPLLGRINGAAYGGGIGLVSVCDVAVAAADVRFCLSEVSMGLLPGMISPFVVRKMGVSNARHYFLNAAVFDAEKAERIGLVHEVAAREELDAVVERHIQAYLRCSPEAIAGTKRLIDFVDRHDTVANFHYTVDRVAQMWASEEGAEGIASFLEKRKPRWAVR
ncbi:MAG: enoyl-CoA hydratase-related protein [Burkholderiales bacterium]